MNANTLFQVYQSLIAIYIDAISSNNPVLDYGIEYNALLASNPHCLNRLQAISFKAYEKAQDMLAASNVFT
jgi:hypothetical protein